MGKGRKGWWSQLQSGDYPDTQKKYGNLNWVIFNNPKVNEDDVPKDNPTTIKLQKECPDCGKLYWVDKNKCYSCGWYPSKNLTKYEKVNSPPIKEIINHYGNKTKKEFKYQICCPRCGGKMILRTAKKGKNIGKNFWGCSQFPKCRGTSSY